MRSSAEKLGDLLRRQWTRKEIALGELAPERPDLPELLLRLDAFGDDRHADLARQLANGDRNLRLSLAIAHASHEALVDLDGVERQLVQVLERRVPGPEIVDMNADAERAEVVEHSLG